MLTSAIRRSYARLKLCLVSREIDDSTVELREAIDARDYHAESVLVPWLTELRNERDRLQVRLAYLSHRTTAKPKGQSK